MVSRTKRIKVLFTIPNFDTAGSGKALFKVASRLNPLIFDVHIACLHNQGSFFKVVASSGIPIHVFEFTVPMKPYFKGIKACFKIAKKLKAIAPDIIHSFHYSADYSEALSAKIAGIPWVYTKKNMNWGGASKNGWYLRNYLATAILAQNEDMVKTFFKNSKKVELIPRGVDTNEFKPITADLDLKSRWNLGASDRILICVANLVPVKGIEVLLYAFKEARFKFPEWKLLIVGDNDGEYGYRMVGLSKTLLLEEFVIFCGKQSNINDYLSIAECFVLPTLDVGRREGSPVSLLEAMAAEKYVLGSDIPGIRDQLEKYPSHLFEAGNAEALSKALVHIFSNTTKVNNKIGKQFRRHVLGNFNIENEVKNCEQLYLSIITKSNH